MSAGRYLLCWLFVGLSGLHVHNEQWPWLAIDIGLFVLLISDAVVGSLKEGQEK